MENVDIVTFYVDSRKSVRSINHYIVSRFYKNIPNQKSLPTSGGNCNAFVQKHYNNDFCKVGPTGHCPTSSGFCRVLLLKVDSIVDYNATKGATAMT